MHIKEALGSEYFRSSDPWLAGVFDGHNTPLEQIAWRFLRQRQTAAGESSMNRANLREVQNGEGKSGSIFWCEETP